MAPAPSRVVRLHRRPAAAPVAPLLSPTTCVWSVPGRPTDRPSALSKLSSIHNADLDRQMARRWLDEDYDFYAPEEVARRNELYEAFARRVAALQSGDAGLGGRTDLDEYNEPDIDGLLVAEKSVVFRDNLNTVLAKPISAPRSPVLGPQVSATTSTEQATEAPGVDFLKTPVAEVPETEASREPQEKNVSVTSSIQEGLVASKVAPSAPSPSFSEVQRQEFEMVKEYLAKLAADFEWRSTASQGLKPTSEDCVIGLSAYITAFGFEKALKHVCGVLSLESPCEARPTAIEDDSDGPLSQGSSESRAVEKGVFCTPPRRFYGAPDALLNRSRETLVEELQRLGIESALPQVAG